LDPPTLIVVEEHLPGVTGEIEDVQPTESHFYNEENTPNSATYLEDREVIPDSEDSHRFTGGLLVAGGATINGLKISTEDESLVTNAPNGNVTASEDTARLRAGSHESPTKMGLYNSATQVSDSPASSLQRGDPLGGAFDYQDSEDPVLIRVPTETSLSKRST
jgi:hypothetical protein